MGQVHSEASHAKGNSGQQHSAAAAPATVQQVPQTKSYPNPCGYGQTREDSDLCAQWTAATAARDASAWEASHYQVEFAGAIAIGVSLIFSGLAAFAAVKAERAARQGVENDRAWMTFDHMSLGDMIGGKIDGHPVELGTHFGIGWINTGRSPALNAVCTVAHRLVPEGEAAPVFERPPPKEPLFAATGANGKAGAPRVFLNDAETIQFKSGQFDLILYCRIAYSEIFHPKVGRTSEICFRIEFIGKPQDALDPSTSTSRAVGPQNTVS